MAVAVRTSRSTPARRAGTAGGGKTCRCRADAAPPLACTWRVRRATGPVLGETGLGSVVPRQSPVSAPAPLPAPSPPLRRNAGFPILPPRNVQLAAACRFGGKTFARLPAVAQGPRAACEALLRPSPSLHTCASLAPCNTTLHDYLRRAKRLRSGCSSSRTEQLCSC
jgi:hypothetical protein